MAHWLDIGGTLGGMTTDIYSEGLQIPIVKLHDRGEVNEDLVDIIAQNVRMPSRAMGDLRAQITAVKTGERRFLELVDRYGRDAGSAARSQPSWTTPRRRRARARARFPTASTRPNPSWTTTASRSASACRSGCGSIVKGDEMTIDLTEVSRQVRGFYNSGMTTGYACAQVAYKCLTSPTDYPINDGSFRSLKVDRAAGTRRQRGAAGADALVDDLPDDDRRHDLQGAGAGDPGPRHRRPSRRSADRGAPRHQHRRRTSSSSPISARIGGGWGAKRSEDGVCATVCINDGDTHNSPNEQVEAKFPIVVERYALRAGFRRRRPPSRRPRRRARGARAAATSCSTPRSSASIAGRGDSTAASDGAGNEVALRIDGTWKTDFPNAKVLVASSRPGDAFRLRSGGGGGYGSPFERPVAQVQDDVRQGYVSAKEAAAHYGVAIDPQTFEVEEEETARLRARRA